MKKKILLTLCSCFMLGLAGCDTFGKGNIVITEIPQGNDDNTNINNNSNTNPDSSCIHDYVAVNDTVNHMHFFQCSKCGEKTDLRSHSYVEDESTRIEATCTEKGSYYKRCVCGDLVRVEIAPLGHLFGYSNTKHPDDKPATCTESGVENRTCTRCGFVDAVEIAPYGHEWENVEGTEVLPTCISDGSVDQKCKWCDATQNITIPVLGHDFLETSINQEGYIDMKDFTCTRDDCNDGILCWDAKDVSDNCTKESREINAIDRNGDPITYSEPDYVENEDGSVSFFGRGIHNAAYVPNGYQAGGWTSEDFDPIYNEDIAGSFLEYKINLPENRNGCNLVADVKANQYMDNIKMFTNVDTDWTPGLKKVGDQVVRYPNRYVVTIDGVELEQDLDSAYNIVAREDRMWYTFPLTSTLDLAQGEHVIRISMAGGYIASFYRLGLEIK